MESSTEELILGELRALRQEVRELRALLTGEVAQPASPPVEAAGTAAPDLRGSWLLQNIPEGLRRRVQPLLSTLPPLEDGPAKVKWLLEFSENVEDFVRYEGEDWPAATAYMDQLQQLQEAWGLQRLVPREGDEVDAQLHLVLQSLPNPEKRDRVARCARPGFILDGEILRRAEVVVYL